MNIKQGENWEETRERNGMNEPEFIEKEKEIFSNFPTPPTTDWEKEFDEEFCYWVIKGSTLNDGSELRISKQLPQPYKDFIKNTHTDLARTIRDDLMGKIDNYKKRDNGETHTCYRCGLPKNASEKLMLGCRNDKGLPYKSHLFRKNKNLTKKEVINKLVEDVDKYFKDRFNV